MKELSIEEKAKAYDEAIKVIKDNLDALNEIHETGANVVNIQSIRNCFYRAFPELKESEDERIRKALVKLFESENFNGYVTLDSIDIEDVLTWLEKQGESDETKAKMFLINKGYPIDTNSIFPTYEEMYNIIREGLERQVKQEEHQVYETEDGETITYSETDGYKVVEPKFHEGEWITIKE